MIIFFFFEMPCAPSGQNFKGYPCISHIISFNKLVFHIQIFFQSYDCIYCAIASSTKKCYQKIKLFTLNDTENNIFVSSTHYLCKILITLPWVYKHYFHISLCFILWGKMKVLVFFCFLFELSLFDASTVRYDNYKVYRLLPTTHDELQRLHDLEKSNLKVRFFTWNYIFLFFHVIILYFRWNSGKLVQGRWFLRIF